MSILSPNIRPPPDVPRPDFAGMAVKAASERVENRWFRIPAQKLTVGFEDPESDDGPDRFFAWDNEREPYDVEVPAFEAQARPVSIGEYAAYLVDAGLEDTIPATWIKLDANGTTNGSLNGANGHSSLNGANGHSSLNGANGHNGVNGHIVNSHGALNRISGYASGNSAVKSFISRHGMRTVWGPIPLAQTLDWPLTASYNEVAGYAQWVGGVRIPTLHEVRSIHELVERQRRGGDTAAKKSPSAINKTCHTEPSAIFADLEGCNVGMQNFHPTPVTQNGGRLCGLGNLGGAWEWTSDLFAPQPGFKPMDIYPGYSHDFMDGKHIAIAGGSWAVPPRIAGRKSL